MPVAVEWSNDHTRNSSTDKWALKNIVTPQVALAHPDWSKKAIKNEAFSIWRSQMEQNKQSTKSEANHEDGIVTWDIERVNGRDQLVTDWGVSRITLEDLWKNTERRAASLGKSHLVDKEEKKAQLEMQRRIVTGKAEAQASVIGHPDRVEYIQTWEKTGKHTFVSRQIDMVKTIGRTLSHSEGAQLIQHLMDFLQQSTGAVVSKAKALYPHFMIEIGKIQAEVIRTIARSMESARQSVRSVGKEIKRVAERTFLPLQGVMERTLKNVRTVLEKPTSQHQLIDRKEERLAKTDKKINVEAVPVKREPFKKRTVSRIERMKALLIEKFIPMSITRKVDRLYEKFKLRVSEKLVTFRKNTIEKYRMRVRKSIRALREQKVFVFIKRFFKEKKQLKHKEFLAVKVSVNKERITLQSIRNRVGEEFRHISEKVRLLFLRKERKKVEVKKIEYKRLGAFTRALIIFTLLQRPQAYYEKKFKAKGKMEKLYKITPRFWLMQAIIYEMTRVLEAGMVNGQTHSQPKKVKKNIMELSFATQGVIFAYAT